MQWRLPAYSSQQLIRLIPMPLIPGRTGIRPAYRPQTFITDADGQWRPSKLLVGLHEPQGRHTEALRELRSQLILQMVQGWTHGAGGDWRSKRRRPQHDCGESCDCSRAARRANVAD